MTSSVKVMDNPSQIQNDINYHVKQWELRKDYQPKFNPISYGVPKKYMESTFENFVGNLGLIKALKEYSGGGLVLSGNTGTGKTHLAVSLMRNLETMEWIQYCQENINLLKAGVEASTRHKSNKVFITAPELLLEIRKSFQNDSEYSESDILDRYSKCGLLVLDDLGSEKTTEYAITTLYILINRRDSQLKNTVITTNLSLAEIEEKLNARIASRLSGWRNMKISMPDYRKTKEKS